MKFLVEPFLAYFLLQVAGLLVVQRRTVGWSRRIIRTLLLVTLLLGVLAIPLLARGLEASLLMPQPSSGVYAPDFIVVLGGGYLRGKTVEEDILNTPSEQRVLEGIAVWRRFPEARLVLSGTVEHDGRSGNRLSQLMAEAAEARGVPVSALLPEPRSRNTREHPVEVLKLSGVTTAAPIAVVTSGRHTRRAWREFCRHFQYVQTYAVPEITSSSGWQEWILSAGALDTNTLLLREWVGILWSNLTEKGLQCEPDGR